MFSFWTFYFPKTNLVSKPKTSHWTGTVKKFLQAKLDMLTLFNRTRAQMMSQKVVQSPGDAETSFKDETLSNSLAFVYR